MSRSKPRSSATAPRAQTRRRSFRNVTRGRRRTGPPALPRRWKRRRHAWLIAIVLVIALIIADRQGWLIAPAVDDLNAYDGAAVLVERVIDGDTLVVMLPDALHGELTTTIRLWGIDCPETARFGSPDEPWAREALILARDLADGRIVRLTLEPHRPRDSFDRVLAHVQCADGRGLAEALLDAGLARADPRWRHRLAGRYEQLEVAARRRGEGLWSSDP